MAKNEGRDFKKKSVLEENVFSSKIFTSVR